MQITFVERGSTYSAIFVQYAMEKNSQYLETDILLITGKNLDSQVKVSQFHSDNPDSENGGKAAKIIEGLSDDWCYLSSAGPICLPASFQALDKVNMKSLKGDAKGSELLEHFRATRSQTYMVSMLLVLTKSY